MKMFGSRLASVHFGGAKTSFNASAIQSPLQQGWKSGQQASFGSTMYGVPECSSLINLQQIHTSTLKCTCPVTIGSNVREVSSTHHKTDCRTEIAKNYECVKHKTVNLNHSCNRTSWSRYRHRENCIMGRNVISRLMNQHQCSNQLRSYSTLQNNQVSHSTLLQPGGIHCRTFMTSQSHRVELNSMKDFKGPSLSDITTYLRSKKMSCQIGYACIVLPCPFCEGISNSSAEKSAAGKGIVAAKNLYINMTTGLTICQCGKICGAWDKFKKSIDIQKKSKKGTKVALSALPLFDEEVQSDKNEENTAKINAMWKRAVDISTCNKDYMTGLKTKFPIKALKESTYRRFDVRVDKSKGTLLVPIYGLGDEKKQLEGLVILDMGTDTDMKKKVTQTYILRNNHAVGLFGHSLVPADSEEIILTESVLDALAVYQGTGSQAVMSLLNGSTMLPLEVLPHLERFSKVTLWFDNNMRSWETCKQFARKLNNRRCHLIRPLEDHPSPLATLNRGKSLKIVLNKAVAVSHKFITSFRSLRQEVLGELSHAEQVAGVKWKRFDKLNKILKGHRRGELTVFTGPTGAGKTTFMAEYSLDLCMQGVNTLWGSFEIQNVRLAKVMLTQFSCVNLSKNLDKFDSSADKFEKLPLYFMAFHGEQSLDRVLEAMNHAVYVHDIHHVIIDNLQFMIGYNDRTASFDRFTIYDNFIAAFRKFATNNNCHVSLVIHPRKEKESEELHTSSIFGSAKASQEADNVLILQDPRFTNPKARKFVQITKNRFDGESGKVIIHFNKDTLTMSQGAVPKKPRKTKKQTVDTDENLSAFQSSYDDLLEEENEGESNLEIDEANMELEVDEIQS